MEIGATELGAGISVVVAAVVGIGWGLLRKYVKSTPAKWDDRLLDDVEKGINNSKKEGKK